MRHFVNHSCLESVSCITTFNPHCVFNQCAINACCNVCSKVRDAWYWLETKMINKTKNVSAKHDHFDLESVACITTCTATHCNALQHNPGYTLSSAMSSIILDSSQCRASQLSTHIVFLINATSMCVSMCVWDDQKKLVLKTRSFFFLSLCHASQLALQHTATHCNALQHTATHCNALQRTATHSHIHTLMRHVADHFELESVPCITTINTHWYVFPVNESV